MKQVKYIIVVHGIGEQRRNETVLPVINRFANARQGQDVKNTGRHNPLTLGMLTSQQTTVPWIEFSGIPSQPDMGYDKPFIGRTVSSHGVNLRFVDLHWASVMQGHFDEVGQPLEQWTRSLIDRLELRQADDWVPNLLRTMRKGLLPLKKLLSLRLPGMSDKVFNQILGDVQLYGEYAVTRGWGVRRFHDILARVHQAHQREFREGDVEPRYIIIAHSLGSVMAFDALLFGHGQTREAAREVRLDLPHLDTLLPGYRQQQDTPGRLPKLLPIEKLPGLDWIKYVDTLVTLGSPIDKFLTLYWMNYEHLAQTDWFSPELLVYRGAHPIRHYNYCDEQDPVGHELDVAYTAKAVQTIFGEQPREDVVFMRYGTPGMAHTRYWKDQPLFNRILGVAVDNKPKNEVENIDWFSLSAYRKALSWTYLRIPFIGWVLSVLLMLWANIWSPGWKTTLFAGLSSIGMMWFTLWVMNLMVQWRQLATCTRTKMRSSPSFRPHRRKRMLARYAIRSVIIFSPFVWLYLLVKLSHVNGPEIIHSFCGKVDAWMYGVLYTCPVDGIQSGLYTALVYAFLIGLFNLAIFLYMKYKWGRKNPTIDFAEYIHNDPSR